ncbi:TIR domain-containing protein [Pseudofrankia sp. BMG5.37]|uniref:TIR domain-containing protein n=1 Tax=Pseudofrankia sp. BMG5.37 TaxID=3050035 RepID=UPI002894F7B8|nr:TIR domain-containing protein [Pseudofrankia sp. BMG5.37]MDT3438265.1 TIR domain-containing protein [Pseudofrankia sp. BMG5.37]
MADASSQSETDRPRIFLSYAHQDHDWALHVAGALAKCGENVWLDNLSAAHGRNWQEQILDAISVRDAVVILLTNHTVQTSWVEALDRREVDVIPALLAPVEIPARLAGRTAVDMTVGIEPTVQELVDRVERGASLDLRNLGPEVFERLVADLLQRYGYAVADTSTGPDRGYDFRINYDDRLGLLEPVTYIVEVKAYRKGRPSVEVVHRLAAKLDSFPDDVRGLLVANTQLTSVARDRLEVESARRGGRIRLLDGPRIRSLLLEHPDLMAKYRNAPEEAGPQ